MPTLIVAVTVGACASSSRLTDSRAGASAQPTDDLDPICELLTEPQRQTLAGEQLVHPSPELVGGLPVCKWGDPEGTWIQLMSVPANTWAEQLPALMDQLEAAGVVKDPEDIREFAAARDVIRSGEDIAPARACQLFRSVLEVQGEATGSYFTINAVPGSDDLQAINGQICTAGTFTAVLLVRDDLTGSTSEASRVARALRAAHRRGLQSL